MGSKKEGTVRRENLRGVGRRILAGDGRARYGVLDVGVNAIRLNAIAAALRAKGWTIGAIDAKQYPDYFVGNDEARASVAGEQVKASNVFNR